MPLTRHELEFDETKFTIFEAMPLNEPPMKDDDYFRALETPYKFVKQLSHAGIHLLLFCMRAGKIKATARMNHRLFVETMCQSKVP
ncbi:hypothetical protein JVU11DRAFT_2963 [Chiua virens]|nr:hypothetical protein JVU11DRAFT_2963 [Chiua virens]